MRRLIAILALVALGGCATAPTASDYSAASEFCGRAVELAELRVGVLQAYEAGHTRANIESAVGERFDHFILDFGIPEYERILGVAEGLFYEGWRVADFDSPEVVGGCMEGYLS